MGEIPVIAKGGMWVAGAIGILFGTVTTLDARYELKEVHGPQHVILAMTLSDLSWNAYKQTIRDIRKELVTETDPTRREGLKLELQDAIDRLCLSFKEDRECK